MRSCKKYLLLLGLLLMAAVGGCGGRLWRDRV